MNYIIIEAQTTGGTTAIVTPAVYDNAVEAEAVFLEKCAAARRSGLDTHAVVLMQQDGKVRARKAYEK